MECWTHPVCQSAAVSLTSGTSWGAAHLFWSTTWHSLNSREYDAIWATGSVVERQFYQSSRVPGAVPGARCRG
jgi:hypothetical protein